MSNELGKVLIASRARGKIAPMLASSAEIDRLSEAQLREFTAALVQELALKQALTDRLTHEMAIIKRLRFAAKSEHFNAQQKGLFDEDGDADLEALAQQLEQLASPQTSKVQSQTPKRQTLPADLPRREVRHEPNQTLSTCRCSLKRIGEDIAEKLDYAPVADDNYLERLATIIVSG